MPDSNITSFVSYLSFVSKGLESQRILTANWSHVPYLPQKRQRFSSATGSPKGLSL